MPICGTRAGNGPEDQTVGGKVDRAMEVKLQGSTMELPSGKYVTFDSPICEVVEMGEVLIVRMKASVDRTMNENVCAVDHDGRFLWRMQSTGRLLNRRHFVRVRNAGSLVRLFDVEGRVYDLDPESGTVVSSYSQL